MSQLLHASLASLALSGALHALAVVELLTRATPLQFAGWWAFGERALLLAGAFLLALGGRR